MFVQVFLATAIASASLVAQSKADPAAVQDSTAHASTPRRDSPFACNRVALTPAERVRHFDELGPSLRMATPRAQELPDGFEFEFPPGPAIARLLSEWVIGERLCCPFFDIAIRWEREGGPAWLRLTGRPGVKQFIKADLARWFHQ